VPEHLRRRVRRGQHLQRDRRVAGLGQHGQAEVGQRGLTEPGEQDIRRLHVPVQDAQVMRVGERVGNLHADLARLDRGERAVAHPLRVRAGTQLHDQVRVALGGHPAVEEIHHVRVTRHPPGGPRLAEEPALVAFAVQGAVLHLDRHLAADRVLHRPVDRGVPAAGQHDEPAEARDRGRREPAGGDGHG
jgi:hypothetical protein